MIIKLASITVPNAHIREDMSNEKRILRAAKEMLNDDKKALLEKKAWIGPVLSAIKSLIGPAAAAAGKLTAANPGILKGLATAGAGLVGDSVAGAIKSL